MTEKRIRTVHFIGVGGVGMSGVARVAHDQGMTVTGSDLKESRYTKQLKAAGLEIHIGHSAGNIPENDPDVVVVSTAILENNEELLAARERGLTIWHRAKMLAVLGRGKETLAVAGTHGKTTSSSMLASTLEAMGEDPTFLIGGIVRAFGTNAHSGKGEYYVVEADESDKSFTYLDPHAVLVTNIEADHLDHYRNIDEIYQLFREFIESVHEDGVCVVCGEDAELTRMAKEARPNTLTYGFGDGFDISITDYCAQGIGSEFSVIFPDKTVARAHIKQNPGRHNVLNGAGVLGLLWAIGKPVAEAVRGLGEFSGVRRRFDLVGNVDNITIVDDYAHHPTEIAATIAAAKKLGYKHVHVLFQPHRYSRVPLFTEVLKDEFGRAFDEADSVTFMDVYPAGEMPIPGVTGKTFLNVVLEHVGSPEAAYVPRRIEVIPYLKSKLMPGDLLVTMGAGDVTAIGPEFVAALSNSERTLSPFHRHFKPYGGETR